MVRIGYPGRPVHLVASSSPINPRISGELSNHDSCDALSGATLGTATRATPRGARPPEAPTSRGSTFRFLERKTTFRVGRLNAPNGPFHRIARKARGHLRRRRSAHEHGARIHLRFRGLRATRAYPQHPSAHFPCRDGGCRGCTSLLLLGLPPQVRGRKAADGGNPNGRRELG